MARSSGYLGAAASVPAQESQCLADITKRLVAEFAAQIDVATISRVVLECRDELRDAPPAALAELIERHARQRLLASRGAG